MQNDRRSHGLWEVTAPPAPPTAALGGEISTDVVVVGGGFTGASAALHLAEGGARVVLLEAVEIGYGAAGRNAGLVNAGMWVMPDALLATLGVDYGARLLDLLGNAPRVVFDLVDRLGLVCDARPVGTLHCAVGESGLRELRGRAAQWQARGAPVDLLDAATTAAKTGTSIYPGALLDRRAGTIQPLAYVRGLAGAALAAGARLFTGSPVVAVEPEGLRWRVRTAGGSVTAAWIVMATDAYTRGPWSALRTEQVHLPYFNVATVPLGDNVRRTILPDGEGAWDTKSVLTHFRLDGTGRLIVGSVGALRGTGGMVHRHWARRHIRRLFPQLGDIALEAEWYGKIGMTDDNLPRFHRLAPNVLAFSGYNGRGIAPGTVFGRVLARHILGELKDEELPIRASEAAPARFRGAREAWYEIGAQLAHLPAVPL